MIILNYFLIALHDIQLSQMFLTKLLNILNLQILCRPSIELILQFIFDENKIHNA